MSWRILCWSNGYPKSQHVLQTAISYRSNRLIDCFLVFYATFSNISAISWPVLVVEEAGVPGENHRQWESNW